MTKIDIVDSLYEKVNYAKSDIAKLVDTVFDIIKETLQHEDKILISGFGDFVVRKKKARRGRSPHTGEEIMLSPRRY